jgi:hypothetical protein
MGRHFVLTDCLFDDNYGEWHGTMNKLAPQTNRYREAKEIRMPLPCAADFDFD